MNSWFLIACCRSGYNFSSKAPTTTCTRPVFTYIWCMSECFCKFAIIYVICAPFPHPFPSSAHGSRTNKSEEEAISLANIFRCHHLVFGEDSGCLWGHWKGWESRLWLTWTAWYASWTNPQTLLRSNRPDAFKTNPLHLQSWVYSLCPFQMVQPEIWAQIWCGEQMAPTGGHLRCQWNYFSSFCWRSPHTTP